LKKIFLSILLLTLNLSAFDTQMASKIFDKIFLALIDKKEIYVYTKDERYYEVIEQAPHLSLVKNSSYADIVLVNNCKNLSPESSLKLFTTNLTIYKKREESIGIFYWKHGRPKIIFSKERLKKFNIIVNKQWQKYIISDSKI